MKHHAKPYQILRQKEILAIMTTTLFNFLIFPSWNFCINFYFLNIALKYHWSWWLSFWHSLNVTPEASASLPSPHTSFSYLSLPINCKLQGGRNHISFVHYCIHGVQQWKKPQIKFVEWLNQCSTVSSYFITIVVLCLGILYLQMKTLMLKGVHWTGQSRFTIN